MAIGAYAFGGVECPAIVDHPLQVCAENILRRRGSGHRVCAVRMSKPAQGGANLGFVIDIRLGQPLFDHLQIDWILDNVQVIRNLAQQKSP